MSILGGAIAADTPSPETLIESAARAELLAEASQAGWRDPSVRIEVVSHSAKPAPCGRKVEIEPLDTRFMTRMRFRARCPDRPDWHAEYVVRGFMEAQVLVVQSAIPAGQPIEPAQIGSEKRDISQTPGALSEPDAVIGKESQRPLHRGQILDRRWLNEPVLVKRGARVSILARNGNIQVQVPGEALEEGRKEAVVRVRNGLNGKIIRARVMADGTVEPVDVPQP